MFLRNVQTGYLQNNMFIREDFPWALLTFQHLKPKSFLFCAPLPSTPGTFIPEYELKQSYWLLSRLMSFQSLMKRLEINDKKCLQTAPVFCCASSTSAWGAAAIRVHLSFLVSHLSCLLFCHHFFPPKESANISLKKLTPITSSCPSCCSCLLFLHLVLEINVTTTAAAAAASIS